MHVRDFHIDKFLRRGDFFHFARKTLPPQKPRFLHRHDFFELLFVVQGQTEHRVDDRISRLGKGSVVFIRPDDRHALRAVRGERNEIINVAFRSGIAAHLGERYAEEVRGKFFWHDRPDPERYELSGPRYERAVNLSSELQFSRNTLASIEEYLLAFLTRVVELDARANPTAPGWLLAASAAAKRPEVFREGAAGFVKAAGRGHEHVSRMARKHLGVSPSALVNRIRMEHAALMLAGSDLSINDISNECGIENLSHFYRVFQRQYGTTPRQYRMQHQKNPLRAH